MKLKGYLFGILFLCSGLVFAQEHAPLENFDAGWKFYLGNDSTASKPGYNDTKWRKLNLPHDWSIEGNFGEKETSTTNEGALPTGVGWYRKTFTIPVTAKDKQFFIDFDGVYKNSEVWINGHYLGKRPNGYISFRYELTKYLHFSKPNVIAVKVDNSEQPNSRWYSGSGIYRNVWLVSKGELHFSHWGTVVNTPKINESSADINISFQIEGEAWYRFYVLKTVVYDESGKIVKEISKDLELSREIHSYKNISQYFKLVSPKLWSVKHPNLYRVVSKLYYVSEDLSDGNILVDTYSTNLGIRYFNFDSQKGFSLNGKPLKIQGVCLHNDMGALGTAVNTRAMERQLQILKAMGCNAIRTSHNPPAPEFLDLCDKMGFLVMDEAFDMWAKKKNKFDYHLDWGKWHKTDLEDQIKRDRNHPSVFMWSIGNEIREQFDSTGITIGKELVGIIKSLDATRPVTSALSENKPEKNFIYQSHALDVVGLNYHTEAWANFPKNYPGEKFIATETTSALESRGHYDNVSDTTVRWPHDYRSKLTDGNADMTVSAYDNVAAYWGGTHEESWKRIKKYPYLSGMFVWTGFDYIGEPTPYPWPARSSYFGIVDLAGFPKDVYYMYQSEWTTKPVLHLLPHWNWQPGKIVDVWAYYSQADEVELYLNGRSLGIKKKQGDDLHVAWKVLYEPGTLKAISRLNGKVVLTQEIKTSGKPAKIQLIADRSMIKANGNDLSYITVKVLDADGNLVPDADNLVKFTVTGPGFIAGVDNGQQTSLEPFKAKQHKVFNGLGLAIIQAKAQSGKITITANADGLQPAVLTINSK